MTEKPNKGPKFSPTIYKGMLLSIMTMAFVLPLGFVSMPYLEFFNGMAVQPKAKAQGRFGRAFGADEIRHTRHLPVAGTIPRGYWPHPYDGVDVTDTEAYAKIIAEAGERFINPTTPTLENQERGQKLYDIYCIVCHGKDGLGNGPVVGPGRFPAPTSLHDATVKAYKDGSFYQVITNGKGKMPAYAGKIEPEDRWAVVNYVRALQRAQAPHPEDFQE